MKVITLTQPWASLVVLGEKEIETRSWATTHRGEIAIHAATGLGPVGGKSGLEEMCNKLYFRSALLENGLVERLNGSNWLVLSPRMVFGAIIGVAELYHVEQTAIVRHCVSENEMAFGDYSPGRYAWMLRNVRRLDEPIATKGQLRLWNFDLKGDANG